MQQDEKSDSEELRLLLVEEVRLEIEHANLAEFRKNCREDQVAELAALVQREARYVSDRAVLEARLAGLVSKKSTAGTNHGPLKNPPSE